MKWKWVQKTVIFGSGCWIAACTSFTPPPEAGQASTVASKIPQRKGIHSELVQSIPKEKQPWVISKAYPENEKFHYIVGLSSPKIGEKEARHDAMRDARRAYANFAGVSVSMFNEYVAETHGEASEVLQTQITSKTESEQFSEAFIRGSKLADSYVEQLKRFQDQTYLDTVWKYWVLVSVPKEEWKNIQAWKQPPLINSIGLDLQIQPSQPAIREGIQLRASCQQRCYLKVVLLTESGEIYPFYDSQNHRLPKTRPQSLFQKPVLFNEPGRYSLLAFGSVEPLPRWVPSANGSLTQAQWVQWQQVFHQQAGNRGKWKGAFEITP